MGGDGLAQLPRPRGSPYIQGSPARPRPWTATARGLGPKTLSLAPSRAAKATPAGALLRFGTDTKGTEAGRPWTERGVSGRGHAIGRSPKSAASARGGASAVSPRRRAPGRDVHAAQQGAAGRKRDLLGREGLGDGAKIREKRGDRLLSKRAPVTPRRPVILTTRLVHRLSLGWVGAHFDSEAPPSQKWARTLQDN